MRRTSFILFLFSSLLLHADASNESACEFPFNVFDSSFLAQNEIDQGSVPHLYSPSAVPRKDDTPTITLKRCPPSGEGYTVNFENIKIKEFIKFISEISGTNFIFDDQDLNFNITIISEDQTSIEDLMAALLQILQVHGLSAVEQGSNVLIHRNEGLSRISTIITDDNLSRACEAAIITRVFRLYNLSTDDALKIVTPLVSRNAVVEKSDTTRHLIVTDITANVDRIAELIQALDVPIPTTTLEIGQYEVRNADTMTLVNYAERILGPLKQEAPFQLEAQPESNKIFIVSTPYLIHKALQVLESLDTIDIATIEQEPEPLPPPPPPPPHAMVNNNFLMYKLKYQNGQIIADAIREIGINLQNTGIANIDFVNTVNSVQWLEVNNSLVMAGTQEAISKVVELIEDLDRQPKQVYIEVLIIDTTLRNSLDFGVQWVALGSEQDKLAFASGLLSNAPPAPLTEFGARNVASPPRTINQDPIIPPPQIPSPGLRQTSLGLQPDVPLPIPANLQGFPELADAVSAFGFGIVGNIIRHNGQSFLTLGALVSALEAEAWTTIVLNPRIMVEDNQVADFFVGQNIPYQTTSTVIQQTGSVTQNIQYEDIGVHLRVVPTISPDNIVTLDITQAIAEVEVLTLTPITRKTLTTTRVHVPDGTFLVMSGNIRDDKECIRSGIPCLGTLPLIGPTFSRNVERREKRNLILFVRPKVVTSIQQGIELTNQEGSDYNWEAHPCSIMECTIEQAPEFETYPGAWPPPVFDPVTGQQYPPGTVLPGTPGAPPVQGPGAPQVFGRSPDNTFGPVYPPSGMIGGTNPACSSPCTPSAKGAPTMAPAPTAVPVAPYVPPEGSYYTELPAGPLPSNVGPPAPVPGPITIAPAPSPVPAPAPLPPPVPRALPTPAFVP